MLDGAELFLSKPHLHYPNTLLNAFANGGGGHGIKFSSHSKPMMAQAHISPPERKTGPREKATKTLATNTTINWDEDGGMRGRGHVDVDLDEPDN